VISDQTDNRQGACDQDQASEAPKLGAGACAEEDISRANSNLSRIILVNLVPSRPCGDVQRMRLCDGQVIILQA